MKSIKRLSKYIPFVQSSDEIHTHKHTKAEEIVLSSNYTINTSNTSDLNYKSLYEEVVTKYDELLLSSRLEIERLQFNNIILQRDIDEKDNTIKRYQEELLLTNEYIKKLENANNNNDNNNNNNSNNEYNNDSSQLNITSSTIFSKADLWTPTSLLKKSEALEVLRSTTNDKPKSPSSEKLVKVVTAVTISSKQKTVSKSPEKYKKRVGFKV
jgi:hypothetical protein